MSNEADMVNHPPHYNQCRIECIDALEALMEAGETDFRIINVIKYLWRWRAKNGLECLKKAAWYLQRVIDSMEPPKKEEPVLTPPDNDGEFSTRASEKLSSLHDNVIRGDGDWHPQVSKLAGEPTRLPQTPTDGLG